MPFNQFSQILTVYFQVVMTALSHAQIQSCSQDSLIEWKTIVKKVRRTLVEFSSRVGILQIGVVVAAAAIKCARCLILFAWYNLHPELFGFKQANKKYINNQSYIQPNLKKKKFSLTWPAPLKKKYKEQKRDMGQCRSNPSAADWDVEERICSQSLTGCEQFQS